MPKRVQRTRKKGGGMPPGSKYVGRGSRWGNIFVAVKWGRKWYVRNKQSDMTGQRAFSTKTEALQQACSLFDYHLRRKYPTKEAMKAFLEPLKGFDLACWCPVEEYDKGLPSCHANVLLKLIREIE